MSEKVINNVPMRKCPEVKTYKSLWSVQKEISGRELIRTSIKA